MRKISNASYQLTGNKPQLKPAKTRNSSTSTSIASSNKPKNCKIAPNLKICNLAHASLSSLWRNSLSFYTNPACNFSRKRMSRVHLCQYKILTIFPYKNTSKIMKSSITRWSCTTDPISNTLSPRVDSNHFPSSLIFTKNCLNNLVRMMKSSHPWVSP